MPGDLAHCHGQPLAERPHAAAAGRGPFFCAGADLAGCARWLEGCLPGAFDRNREDARVLAHLMQALDELPFPTGAGTGHRPRRGPLGLICACDIVLASEDARFCSRR